MWCPNCRQDVPGIASGTDGDLVCVRCGVALPLPEVADPVDDLPEHTLCLPESEEALGDTWLWGTESLDFDDLDERLARARHLLRLTNPIAPVELRAAHFDPPHDEPRRPPDRRIVGPVAAQVGELWSKSIICQLAWLAIGLGMPAFVCGFVLLAWSQFGGRAELWDLGLPIVLGGQAALVLGLLVQLGRQSPTSPPLQAARDEIAASAHPMPGAKAATHVYHTHAVSTTSPEPSLTDLKRQLERLSRRMHEEQS